MKPYYQNRGINIYHGDCIEVLSSFAETFTSCLTDPPYGLGFMSKKWDHGIPSSAVWEVILQSLKPGAMTLAFGGTRTNHRLTCAIEDAGFEIRDCLMWLYGSGFPKSHNILKSLQTTIEKQLREQGVTGEIEWK